jgi:hypothetical protein
MAIYETTVAEFWCYLGVSEKAWPLARGAYRTMRAAHMSGNASISGVTERGLDNRLWQLNQLSRCKNAALRTKLRELIDVTDAFIESVLHSESAATAIELATHLIEGTATLNDDLSAKAKEAQEMGAEEEVRGTHDFKFGDVIDAQKRQELARVVRDSKRSLRTVANVATLAEYDEGDAEGGEAGSDETDGSDDGGNDAGTIEGSPETAPTTDETARLTEKQKRLFAKKDAPSAPPAPEAPKPTETEIKKPEPTVGRDLQAQLAAKLSGFKPANTATAETAPAAESIETE